jgi:hypothetical protein
MSVLGVESSLFEEVGLGLDITAFGKGNSGFWRTSEIAGWHLAAGSCIAFILGMSARRSTEQTLWFLLSVGMALLSTTTGRRKALGIILAFVSLYMLYYIFNTRQNRIVRAFSSFTMVVLFIFGSFGIFFQDRIDQSNANNVDRYTARTKLITLESVSERFQTQGLSAFLRGLEISGPIGFGLGAGANSGNTGIGEERGKIRSLGYVTEGGGGRIVAENGIIGALVGLYIFINLIILSYTNLRLGRHSMSQDNFLVFFGLLLFTAVNVSTFFSAGQLYSDVFVLMILGLTFGAFTSLPVAIANEQCLSIKE